MINMTIIDIRTAYEYQDLIQAIQKIVTGCPYKQGCLVESPLLSLAMTLFILKVAFQRLLVIVQQEKTS